eukprot:jgi/Mesvir1/10638/Mv09276-RA.1
MLLLFGQMDKALAVVRDMKRSGVPLDAHTYSSLLNACAKSGHLKLAFDLHDEMRGAGYALNEISYTSLIDACLKSGSRAGASRAFAVFEEMKAAGIVPTVVTYGCLLGVCEKLASVNEAMALYEEMWASDVVPNDHCHNLLIRICSKAGCVDEALELSKTMIRRHKNLEAASYNSLIRALAPVHVERALRLVSLMRVGGHELTRPVYNVLITGCAREGLAGDALRFHQQMRGRGLEPDRRAASELIAVLSRTGDWETALDICQGRTSLPHATSLSLLITAVARDNLGRALSLYEDVMDKLERESAGAEETPGGGATAKMIAEWQQRAMAASGGQPRGRARGRSASPERPAVPRRPLMPIERAPGMGPTSGMDLGQRSSGVTVRVGQMMEGDQGMPLGGAAGGAGSDPRDVGARGRGASGEPPHRPSDKGMEGIGMAVDGRNVPGSGYAPAGGNRPARREGGRLPSGRGANAGIGGGGGGSSGGPVRVVLDASLYQILLEGCCRSNQVRQAMRIFRDMQTANVMCNKATLAFLANSCLREEMLTSHYEVLAYMRLQMGSKKQDALRVSSERAASYKQAHFKPKAELESYHPASGDEDPDLDSYAY